MPCYIMHLCEGQIIYNSIKQSENVLQNCPVAAAQLSLPDAMDSFLTGTIIPDAIDDKSITHFRPAYQGDLITKYPDVDHILELYPLSHMTLADLGILAHLHMDYLYVDEFWPHFFRFEDKSGGATTVTSDIDHVRMLRGSMAASDTLIDFAEFFSNKYFYGDYDITMPMFRRDYRPHIPVISPVDITVSECRFCYLDRLSSDIKNYILSPAATVPQRSTNVFPYDALREFLSLSAEQFIKMLKEHI